MPIIEAMAIVTRRIIARFIEPKKRSKIRTNSWEGLLAVREVVTIVIFYWLLRVLKNNAAMKNIIRLGLVAIKQ